jgi:hypothetical protein
MAAARFYSSTSGAMNLTADITDADTSITVDSVAGLPGTRPFALVLDPGTASEEIVDVTNASGTTLTVTRGVDGTSAQAHSGGVGNVRHMATARDFREAQEHIGSSSGVHGLTGAPAGTTDVQTLTNKTLEAATLTEPVVDSTGPLEIRVPNPAGAAKALSVTSVGTPVASVSATGRAALTGADLTEPVGTGTPLIAAAPADQSVDIVQVKKDGATVAKFDKDGKLTAAAVTSSGAVSGTTGTFSGAVSSPTITSLQSADTSLGARLDALEADTGWIPLSTSGFAGTIVDPVAYRRVGSVVYMRGNVRSFTSGTFLTLCTLPVGARPSVQCNYGVSSNTSSAMVWSVDTAGAVTVWCEFTTSAYTGLAGIQFLVG